MQYVCEQYFQLTIPVTGIHIDDLSGVDTAIIDGRETEVTFDIDLSVWRAVAADGGLSTPLPGLADNSRVRQIELPAFPAVPKNATEIPRFLHFVWVGHTTMPEPLVRRVVINALRTPGFRTIVHADVASTSLLDDLRKRLTGQVPWITVLNLREQPCFADFVTHPVFRYYQKFLGEAARNYGAASDLLRLYLVHAYGGVYLDVDDLLANEIPLEACPKATPADLLVGACYSAPKYGLSGCCQSHFASHAGNALLMSMLAESAIRLQATGIFSSPRPWRKSGEADSGELNAYVREVLRLTGPQLFSDLINIHRPGMLELDAKLLKAMEVLHYSPERQRYRANRYLAAVAASLAHYRPFWHGMFQVIVGAAGSWLENTNSDA
ncbi:glycosyltransferase [Pinirhizobacter sp.]|jgi:hypothetical protein|uniref:glycosyltransferase n=1 Tax=Pinirhizobacter sp. TaxID=2950432 RepID=UPI002F403193